ncbi:MULTISPECIES: hypothetical protein [Pseudomonas]|uniref:Uncharacterized protein n=1 Tax=Pseudomonas monachiensis TaxID=3060212 RepID=A0ABW9HEC9_9PSED|nr:MULTISPECIES: hypothetical protein [unclassified Pseudomonas]
MFDESRMAVGAAKCYLAFVLKAQLQICIIRFQVSEAGNAAPKQ